MFHRAGAAVVSRLVLVLPVVVVALPMPAVEAANITWGLTPTSSGDWFTPANWGGTLPTTSDTASITNGGTACVTSSDATCSYLLVDPGAITLSGLGELSVSDFEYIGYSNSGSFTQSAGTNNITPSGTLSLGYNSGSSGTYNLGAGSLTAQVECVGYSGSGTFTQSGGTNFTSYGIYLGVSPAASGTYILSGPGRISGTVYLDVGESGTGTFIQSGGTVHSRVLSLGVCVGSSGTYTISGWIIVEPLR